MKWSISLGFVCLVAFSASTQSAVPANGQEVSLPTQAKSGTGVIAACNVRELVGQGQINSTNVRNFVFSVTNENPTAVAGDDLFIYDPSNVISNQGLDVWAFDTNSGAINFTVVSGIDSRSRITVGGVQAPAGLDDGELPITILADRDGTSDDAIFNGRCRLAMVRDVRVEMNQIIAAIAGQQP